MTAPSLSITRPILLLGEGREEELFFQALLAFLGRADVQVLNYAGKANLAARLRAVRQASGFAGVEALGITRDGDSDAGAALQSVQAALRNAELAVPADHGAVVVGQPRVSVFILPDGVRGGALEDLCLAAVPAQEQVCIDDFYQCLDRQPGQPSKGRLQAWLSSLSISGLRLGEAAQKGFLNWEHPAFASIKSFLLGL